MTHRSQKNKDNKQTNNQTVLAEMLKEEKNKYCADCGAKGPRWASWNLGVFVCIRCAGIHRNLGVHISRVKSVNLDSWTDEQMASIQEWGNRRAGLYWECYLPEDFRRPQTDSAMEAFIRKKYEQKKFVKKDGPPPRENVSSAPQSSKPADKQEIKKKKKEEGNIISLTAVSKPVSKVAQPSPPVSSTTAVISRPKPQPDPPATNTSPPSADLLSLSTPSAPVVAPQVSQRAPQTTLESELIDFGLMQAAPSGFSQSIPQDTQQLAGISLTNQVANNDESLLKDDGVANKSAKDSIMALYTPTAAAQQPQMFGVPGGMYITPQHQQQQQQQHPQAQMFNRQMPNAYGQQPVGMPMHMHQQQPNMMQQVQHVAQVQQQMQNLRLHNQPQHQMVQQPNMFGQQNMFAPQQTMNSYMMQHQSLQYQQQMHPQFVSTGPSSNMTPTNMYPAMGGGPSTGHTLSTQLWK